MVVVSGEVCRHHLRLGTHLCAMLLEERMILEELVEAHDAITVDVGDSEFL